MECALCNAGPTGIDGHEGLRLATQYGHGKVIFECVKCEAIWLRAYEGSGRFVWRRHPAE